MNCARCGHALELHGRRGHGACRHGHVHRLTLAVEVTRAAVLAKVPQAQIGALLDKALADQGDPCTCKRHLKRAPRSAA